MPPGRTPQLEQWLNLYTDLRGAAKMTSTPGPFASALAARRKVRRLRALMRLTQITTSGGAKLILATTGLPFSQFRHDHRPLCKAVDYAELFIYDEAEQEVSVSDVAILGALPRPTAAR